MWMRGDRRNWRLDASRRRFGFLYSKTDKKLNPVKNHLFAVNKNNVIILLDKI